MDKIGTAEGHLIIFDRRPDVSWEDKIFHQTATHDGKTIPIWGM